MANECNGSLDTFHEEYPATWQEAFLSSGRPLFTGLSEVPTSPPKYVGEIEGLPVRGGHLKFVKRPDGRIKLWEAPQAGHRYEIGEARGRHGVPRRSRDGSSDRGMGPEPAGDSSEPRAAHTGAAAQAPPIRAGARQERDQPDSRSSSADRSRALGDVAEHRRSVDLFAFAEA
jgi:hypothetical protein